MPFARYSLVALVVICGGLLGVARDMNDDETLAFTKKILDAARNAYKSEADVFVKTIETSFDKREEVARETANKKAVEQVKKEREAFKKWGEVPAKAERTKVIEARARLADAYLEAARNYLRLKQDDAVEAVEKEHREFVVSSAIQTGKRAWLSTLKPFNIRVENRGFTSNGMAALDDPLPLKMKGEAAPHSLYIVPITRSHCELNYVLAGKYTRLIADIGVPKLEDFSENPASGLVFEVMGDGKSLWKSKPVTKLDEYQHLDVKLDKVKTLTLRVNCPGANAWARSVWFEPMVIEP